MIYLISNSQNQMFNMFNHFDAIFDQKKMPC